MKYRLTYTLLLSSLVIAFSDNMAKADWLDDRDKEYETVFQNTDTAFDRAMDEGVAELDQELASIWGKLRQLPEPKTWVGYSEDQKTRIIVDYERGEMSLESFEKSETDLFQDFQDVLLEDSNQLDERAALRRKLINKTKELKAITDDSIDYSRIKRPTTPQPRKQPAPHFIKRELSTLVEPRMKPRFIKRSVALRTGKMANLSRLTVPLRKDRDRLSAQSLQAPVNEAARKYNLPASLILSVIKNESAFNPRARSHANALGLMQLVPTSGGKEAYSYLMGHDGIPGPDLLYDPIENIRLGAAYLHLLNTRYFGKVKDDQTRRHLIIAAYNTGAGNVAKAFTGKMKLTPAIGKINTMSSEDVYQHLQRHLPYAETKTYLARVSRDIPSFTEWDDRV